MSITSRLITVQLPDKEGNLVPFYTYDGYLEEPQRHQLRAARRNYSLAKVSGAAIFAFAAFIVTPNTLRPPANSLSPPSASKDAQSQLQVFSPVWSEALWDGLSLSCTVAVVFLI